MMYTNFYACHPQSCKTETKSAHQPNVSKEFYHTPLMNQRELEDAILLEFSLPGVAKESIKLEWNDKVLTLTAERTLNREGVRQHHREFSDRKFKSVLRIGETLDAASANAQFDQGVLVLKISKKPVHKISIEIN